MLLTSDIEDGGDGKSVMSADLDEDEDGYGKDVLRIEEIGTEKLICRYADTG